MKALVLAAGRGSRLRPLTDYVPKPMLPLRGRPLLEWALGPLVAGGVTDVVVATSWLGEQIEAYFGAGERLGVHVDYSRGDAPAGTAGEIWRARALLDDDCFLVVPADTLCAIDVRELVAFHVERHALLTVVLSTRYRAEVGLAEVDNSTQRLTAWSEKSFWPAPVNVGAYVVERAVVDDIGRLARAGGEVDLPRDVVPDLLSRAAPVCGFVRPLEFQDVGRIDVYDRLLSPEGERVLHSIYGSSPIPTIRDSARLH